MREGLGSKLIFYMMLAFILGVSIYGFIKLF